jgi:hypothetical protein
MAKGGKKANGKVRRRKPVKRVKRARPVKRTKKSPTGQSKRRARAHTVRLQVAKAKKGYRWQTARTTGGRGIPIAVSGHVFRTARSAAYNGRNMNPHLTVSKVEFL